MRIVRPMTVLLAFALLALATGSVAFAEEAEEVPVAASEEDAKLLARAQAYWEARTQRSPAVMDFYAPPEKRPNENPGVTQVTADKQVVGPTWQVDP